MTKVKIIPFDIEKAKAGWPMYDELQNLVTFIATDIPISHTKKYAKEESEQLFVGMLHGSWGHYVLIFNKKGRVVCETYNFGSCLGTMQLCMFEAIKEDE